MFEKGDKVKRIGEDFQEVKQGEIYTFEKYKDDLNIYLKELIYGYAKDKFEKVEEFEIGEEVIWKKYNEVVEIRGFSTNNKPIIEDKYKNVHTVCHKGLSKLKSKDELEKGDKVKTFAEIEKEIICKHYNEYEKKYEFFVKYKNRNDIEITEIVSEDRIEEVIV